MAIELSHVAERLGGLHPLPAQRSGERARGEGFVASGPEGASSPRPSPPLRRGEGETSSGLITRCLNSIAVERGGGRRRLKSSQALRRRLASQSHSQSLNKSAIGY